MDQIESENVLIAQARAGHRQAVELLLLNYHDHLAAYIAGLPGEWRRLVACDDVLQEALTQAWRDIKRFEPSGRGAFAHWLEAIARNRWTDMLRKARAAKRGGGRLPVSFEKGTTASSVADLLEVLACDDQTPSRVAASREAEQAIKVALAGLNQTYEQAIRMRYLEKLPVAEIAACMGRTERAVQMLCNRGLKKLRESLGNASHFLSNGQ